MTSFDALRWTIALGFVGASAACSLALGFDGFIGDTSGDGGPSRRNDDVVAAPRDDVELEPDAARADADLPEADAGDPNGPPRFVDGGSFCEGTSASTFCDDFDTSELTTHWLREGVFAKLTSHAAKSAPNDLVVVVPPATAGGTFVSKITKAFDTPATSVVLGFDFEPERVYLGSSFFILAALEWPRAEDKYSLRLVYLNGSIRLEESNLVPPPNNQDTYHPFFTLPEGKWSRVALDIVLSGGSPGVQISVDGVPVGTRDVLTAPANIDPRPTLILGAVFAASPHTGWTLRYDDVTLTFR